MAIAREVKVGIFVLAGLIAAAAVIFLIGDNRSAFDTKVLFHAHFEDVQGLKKGSTIRMGGVDIGTVGSVRYASDLGQEHIEVSLHVVEREARRLRADSRATIVPKGLLGDKMMEVSAGDPTLPELQAGAVLETSAPGDMLAILGKIQSLSTTAEKVLGNLESTTRVLAEDEFRNDIRQGVAALSGILKSLNGGNGYASRLLHDEKEAENISQLVTSLRSTSGNLQHMTAGLDAAVARINEGPGLVHDVLYDESGTKTVAQIGAAAAEIRDSLQAMRQGSGLARALIFGDSPENGGNKQLDELGQSVAADVAGMSKDLAAVIRGLREGKGTLGALLVDPSVYEDVKMVLGNVQRNRALRALVRYSIKTDGAMSSVEVADPESKSTNSSQAAGTIVSSEAPTSP